MWVGPRNTEIATGACEKMRRYSCAAASAAWRAVVCAIATSVARRDRLADSPAARVCVSAYRVRNIFARSARMTARAVPTPATISACRSQRSSRRSRASTMLCSLSRAGLNQPGVDAEPLRSGDHADGDHRGAPTPAPDIASATVTVPESHSGDGNLSGESRGQWGCWGLFDTGTRGL